MNVKIARGRTRIMPSCRPSTTRSGRAYSASGTTHAASAIFLLCRTSATRSGRIYAGKAVNPEELTESRRERKRLHECWQNALAVCINQRHPCSALRKVCGVCLHQTIEAMRIANIIVKYHGTEE